MEFDNLNQFTENNQMVINNDKSKVMLFNNAKDYDFMPDIVCPNGEALEVVEELKLLGVILTSDLNGTVTPNIFVPRPTKEYGC